jgi:hypothetical protein
LKLNCDTLLSTSAFKFNLRRYTMGLTKRLMVLPGGIGVGRQTASHPIHMASGAYVNAAGTWTDASSRALKTNITELSGDEAAAAVAALRPVSFAYRAAPGRVCVENKHSTDIESSSSSSSARLCEHSTLK